MKKLTQLLFLLILIAVQGSAQEPPVLGTDSTVSPIRQIMATVRNRNKVLIQWKADSVQLADSYCTLERSTNGADYETLSVIKWDPDFINQVFEDEMPVKGINYYRIKISAGVNKVLSPVVTVSIAGDISCKFYPNPVDKLLIVRSEFPVEIQLTDSYGKLWVNQKLASGLQLVDVSLLEKGLYIITLTQKDSRIITEKLVKN